MNLASKTLFLTLILLQISFLNCAKEPVSVDEWIRANQGEKILNLSKKELGTLPANIELLQSVEELTLQYDSLTSIPAELGNLKSLRILNLFGNPIESLPDSLGNLENLEILLLGRSKLKTVPGFVTKLKKLKTLALDETALEFSEADVELISQIPNLEILDITLLRKFKKLPSNIAKLSHLKELYVQKILFEKSDVARLRDELPGVRIKL
ncbi:leucine-rich repeat domain-containing protein [Leptospira ognonensis]|uniref:Leucine-rich repeat domain-containing protein n=1 Tax=Leptospira ognonensis TaxID=2484945 RepID=A0A4R9JY26_9LEPT|nr:leucine-rich repeat domain-containing protein [Leptospira ognonensis]TGL58120.1 leucine-rich repeat domain-containing protein [Leptospira ognonensis]